MRPAAERELFSHDEMELGSRVALWLASERRGWSPLWDTIYWDLVAKGQPWTNNPGYPLTGPEPGSNPLTGPAQ